MNRKNYQKGQATLLAILIITTISIVTAVGVSTRQNSALKRSSYTKQTDQGFACANSAVDTALLCIRTKEENSEDPKTCAVSTPENLTDGSCNYTYSVSAYTPVDGVLKYPYVQKDTVLQINTSNVNNLKLSWSNSESFLEVSHIYLEGTEYKMKKFLFKKSDLAPTHSGVQVSGFSTINSSTGFSLAPQPNSIVRIHPYFADALDLQISSSDSAFNSITQGLKISAKGTAGSVVRNLEVIRTNPQLPAIFDYVLYSEEGSITK